MNNLVISTKKRNLIIGISLSLIIMIIGTTYAYFTWQSSNNPLVDITVEDMADVVFKGGNDIDITDIGPVLDYNDGEITEFYIKKKIEDNLDLSINITPTLLPDNLKHESFKVKLLSSNDNITYNEVSEINFKDKEQDTKYELSVVELNQNKTYYKIIFYIDGNMYNPNTIQGNSFRARIDVSVNTKCPINTVTPVYTDNSGANAPVLAEGMIPVVYDEGLGYWIKADTNAGWYNYTDKIWANAVMVKTDATEGVECSKSRAYYMSSPAYTPVKEEDILAYYVWIPRYKYQLFNATYASGTSSQLIDVVFENGTSTTGTVTCTYDTNGNESCQNKANGNYYTHPAFTFGSTELKGIWVGKFETTGSETTPTIKPGTESLTYITVSSMYNTSKVFNTTTYLTETGVNQSDAHMMKNIEWGAVAYLKQSIYGLGITDIGINNIGINSIGYFVTGCGAASGSSISSTCNAYNTTNGMLASTTGNITGVYDMSGGTWEYVMGNYNNTSGSSELTVSNVPSKYIDIYAGDSVSYSHLGDATGETAGWYSDAVNFVNSSGPWFGRGGYYNVSTYAGVFYFSRNNGAISPYGNGFRVFLATTGA